MAEMPVAEFYARLEDEIRRSMRWLKDARAWLLSDPRRRNYLAGSLEVWEVDDLLFVQFLAYGMYQNPENVEPRRQGETREEVEERLERGFREEVERVFKEFLNLLKGQQRDEVVAYLEADGVRGPFVALGGDVLRLLRSGVVERAGAPEE